MPHFIAVTGLPGSGKTTIAKNLRAEHDHLPTRQTSLLSADDYFYKEGEYNFDPRKLAQAHSHCLDRFIQAVYSKRYLIILHNTCSQFWELDKYVQIAKKEDYKVTVYEIEIDTTEKLRACYAHCVHGVPASTFGEMVIRWETYPGAEKIPPPWIDKFKMGEE